jgi:hypothetical protein
VYFVLTSPVGEVRTKYADIVLCCVLTSPTGGGRSVGIVRWRTLATEFFLVYIRPPIPRDNILNLTHGSCKGI